MAVLRSETFFSEVRWRLGRESDMWNRPRSAQRAYYCRLFYNRSLCVKATLFMTNNLELSLLKKRGAGISSGNNATRRLSDGVLPKSVSSRRRDQPKHRSDKTYRMKSVSMEVKKHEVENTGKKGVGKKQEKSGKKGVPKKRQIFMKTEVVEEVNFSTWFQKKIIFLNIKKKVRWAF